MDSNASASLSPALGLSTLPNAPKAPPSNSGLFPIRAPPSDDSVEEGKGIIESEEEVTINGSENGSAAAEYYLSGEEEFETASERLFVIEPDEETVVGPEDTAAPAEWSSFVSGDFVGFSPPKRTMPIAQVSGDDDEVVDEGFQSEGEDEGLSGVARVPPLTESSETEGLKEVEGQEPNETSEAARGSTGLLGKPENGVLNKNEEVHPSPEKESSLSTGAVSATNDYANKAGNTLAEEPELKPIKSGDAVMKESENDVPSNGAEVGQNYAIGGSSPVEAENSNWHHLAVASNDSRSTLVSLKQEPGEEFVTENVSGSQFIAHENSEVESIPVNECNSSDLVKLGGGNDIVGVGRPEGSLETALNSGSVAQNNDGIFHGGSGPIEAVLNDVGKTAEADSENPRTKPAEVRDQTSNNLDVPSIFESFDQNANGIYDSTSAQGLVSSDAEEPSVPVSPDDDERKDSLSLEQDDEIAKTAKFTSTPQNENLADNTSRNAHGANEGGETRKLGPSGEEDEITENIKFSSNAEDKMGMQEKSAGSQLPDSSISGVKGEEKPDFVDDEDAVETDEDVNLGNSETAELIIKEMERGSTSSQEYSHNLDGQIVSDSDEADTDEEGDGKELFDSAALAALLKAASSANPDGSMTISTPDGPGRIFSVERPAGLGSSIPTLRPAARPTRPNVFNPSDLAVAGDDDSNMTEEEKKLQEKIHQIRVKFLRLVQRLGHTPEETVAAQVLYRLNLAEGIRRGRHTNRAFSLESAKKTALQLESAGQDDLDFSFNVLILGKAGVGKSATINSIFGQAKTPASAFQPATTGVKEISGTVDGIQVRVIDTPGLKSSVMDQGSNRKILSSIKKFMKKCRPDIVLYVDRLDAQTRDFNDIPLLRSISAVLGSSIWLNAIVALTHAASAPPDGPNGSPLSYDVFVAQRSHIVQHSIRQAAGDMRLMNPVALVENHASCRKIRGQSVLPNGQIWRPQLLLLCYSSKILSEANSLLKLQDSSAGKLFGFRIRSPPLPFLLSSLLQSRVHPKLSGDQGGENEDSDIDLADLSDSDEEEGEDEYDQLPPFKPLRKAQVAKLSKEQRKAYFDEYDFRVKLLQKKQWREELKRLKEIKKRGKDGQADYGYGEMGDDFDQENGAPAAVPVPLPDMVLPPSFDGDNPGYRYRFLEPTSGLLARPVLDSHGWDHDCGYDGVSLEESLAIASRFPAAVSVQITKDKKEFNIHLDSSVSAKHGEHGSSLAGFDIQTVGKQLAYILRGETKFKNFKRNKTVAGMSATFLGENVATGLKIEDQISLGKCLSLVGCTGAVRSQGDVAYGANLEARLRQKDYPIGQDQSTLGLSLMKWRGDLALGANFQSQFSIGRNSKVAVRVGLNNKLSGQITVRTSSSEQLQIALVGLLPIASTIIRTIWSGESPYVH